LAILHKALDESKNAYWATEVEVQRLAAAGWIELARSNTDEALKLMRAAADLEDKSEKHPITPGRILPARELLGDMLMQAGQTSQALRAYEQSQEREPNRFRGLYGAAQAAQAVGDRAKARLYYGKLVAMTKNADGARPELTQAKTYLAQQ
jgi:tetratricopeptide (TPR) repeat protein